MSLRLRIIESAPDSVSHDADKLKNKRGRPRKNPQPVPVTTSEETITVAKKRGRKKKSETLGCEGQPAESVVMKPTILVKNYVVRLKITINDLDKIQKRFVNKSQDVGYVSNAVSLNDHYDTRYAEYYNVLNHLEIPLTPVQQISEDLMPKIANIYQKVNIPITPENVPIQLFDDRGTKSYSSDNIRTTSNIILPLLDNNGHWPEKSPYACWNCDTYFTGTPIGLPDKEVNGQFHCHGNFCWFDCVARYLVDHEDTFGFWEKYSLLCLIYQRVMNLPPETKVPFAPPKESLIKYGGPLSYEEYHKMSQSNRTIEIYQLPLIPVMLHISEVYQATNINGIMQRVQSGATKTEIVRSKNKQFIPIDPLKVSKAEENMKQRNDTMLRSSYTLEKCLQRVDKN
jgi:hypothetical protein